MPGYMVREELQTEILRERIGMRTWEYDRKLEEGKGGELAIQCWEKIKGKMKRGKVLEKWEEKRRTFYGERG